MPHGLNIVLALLLAHFLADFPLQTTWINKGKRGLEWRPIGLHLAAHLGMSILALWLFTGQPLFDWGTAFVLLLIVVGHGLLDMGKTLLVRKYPQVDGWALFIGDQLAHVAIVIGAALTLPEVELNPSFLEQEWLAYRPRLLAEALVIVVFVFPAGYLIRYLLNPLAQHVQTEKGDQAGLANAGLILGFIERTLLILAFAAPSMTAVGLIVGAKSLVRFPAFKERAFAEYFLIGTLISVGLAGIGAALLRFVRMWF